MFPQMFRVKRCYLKRLILETRQCYLGAQVMFIYNINDRIKNGVQGTIVSFADGLPVVSVFSETVIVDKVTWSVYAKSDWHKILNTAGVVLGNDCAQGTGANIRCS